MTKNLKTGTSNEFDSQKAKLTRCFFGDICFEYANCWLRDSNGALLGNWRSRDLKSGSE